ncbi:MAG: sulfite exporter TauE/SafE family protein [Intestinibacillus sp.]
MQLILYFIISLGATTVGAMTGMGGGVIIKPVLDVLNQYDVATISMLSCITVFAMAVVSIAKQVRQKTPVPFQLAMSLAIGSMIGGDIGARILNYVIHIIGSNRLALVCQNICLGILIVLVFVYMLVRDHIPSLHLQGVGSGLLVGAMLGFFSSFLGIGGGPINVAAFLLVFSMEIKTATVCSIITILFAQIAKLASAAMTTGFAIFNFSMLPAMVIGAALGGFLGAVLNKRLPPKTVEIGFNAVQLAVLCICIWNIARNLLTL